MSGGFTYFTALVKQALGFDFDAANILKHDGHTLWPARSSCRSWARKPSSRRSSVLPSSTGFRADDALSVGDGANDLPMLEGGGPGRRLPRQARGRRRGAARIDHGDLTALLYLQGYRHSDFIERTDP